MCIRFILPKFGPSYNRKTACGSVHPKNESESKVQLAETFSQLLFLITWNLYLSCTLRKWLEFEYSKCSIFGYY
jgi:hypothetical protein